MEKRIKKENPCGGLFLPYSWFDEGMQSTKEALNQIIFEMGEYLPIKGNSFYDEDIVCFFEKNNLPVARSMKDLQKYREFHRLYKLLLTYKTKAQFLQQWGNTLLVKGTKYKDGIHLKGHGKAMLVILGGFLQSNYR